MKSLTSIFASSAMTLALCIQPAAGAAAQNANDVFEEDFPIVDVATSEITSRLAELEKAFWICDYIVTTYGVDGSPVTSCGEAYEELKRAKFNGDFDELVAWWGVNKAEQHAALNRADVAETNSESTETGEYPDSI
ncbi:MAG: hypothetical protein H0V16_07100 [Burkholderiaceae bacterium]|nr:hypothetical protein [Burkholderiaceae bacterium]